MKFITIAALAAMNVIASVAGEDCARIVHCMNGMSYANADFTGDTGNTCAAECGANCCNGYQGCDDGRFSVCADDGEVNCDGDYSCAAVGGNGGTVGLISGGSCVGIGACYGAGYEGILGDISNGSCVGVNACRFFGELGIAGDIDSCCTGGYSCLCAESNAISCPSPFPSLPEECAASNSPPTIPPTGFPTYIPTEEFVDSFDPPPTPPTGFPTYFPTEEFLFTYIEFDEMDWGDLPEEIRQAYETLGWTEELWYNGGAATDELYWDDLSEAEQEAAMAIGYTEALWNADFVDPPPTRAPTSPSNSPPTSRCFESILNLAGTNGNGCSFIAENQELCSNAKFGLDAMSHCPSSCNSCDEFGCVDSTARFKLGGGVYTCDDLASLSDSDVETYCNSEAAYSTCRGTCNTCDL